MSKTMRRRIQYIFIPQGTQCEVSESKYMYVHRTKDFLPSSYYTAYELIVFLHLYIVYPCPTYCSVIRYDYPASCFLLWYDYSAFGFPIWYEEPASCFLIWYVYPASCFLLWLLWYEYPASCFLIGASSCFLFSDRCELLLPVFWSCTTSSFLFLLGTKTHFPFSWYGTSTALPDFNFDTSILLPIFFILYDLLASYILIRYETL